MMKMMMAIVTPTKAMHCNKDGGILPEGEPESWQGIFFYKIKKNQWDTSGGRAGELTENFFYKIKTKKSVGYLRRESGRVGRERKFFRCWGRRLSSSSFSVP